MGEVEGARYYYVVLYDASGQSVKYLYPDGPGSIAVYGCYFEEGTYTITAYATSSSSQSETSVATVTVTAPGTRPAAPAVTAETTEVVMDAELPFIINATGADMVTMRIGDSGAFDPIAVNGSSTFRWPDDALWEGWQKYSFAVRVNGVWSPFSEPILVNTVPAATMPKPVLDMPETLTAGHDLVISIAAVEGAEHYSIILKDPQGIWLNDQNAHGTTGVTFTFPGYLFAPGTYDIIVPVSGSIDGVYVNNTTYASISVTAGDRPAAPAVTAEAEYALSGSSYAFTIDTTGADKVAVRCMAPDMMVPAASHYELTATGDSTTWTHSYSGPDSMRVKYCFSVCVDGVWSPWSETHTVTIVDELPVQPPVITCADSFLAGEDIVFTVQAPEGAVSCQWELTGSESPVTGSISDTGDTTLSALDYTLPAADNYLLTVTATFEDGSTTQAEHAFAITGARPTAPDITLSEYCVEPGQTTTLTISAAGASQVCLRNKTSGERFLLDVSDGQVAYTFSADTRGSYSINASALCGTQWSTWSSTCCVVVEYPLSNPVCSAPDTISLGSDLIVTIEPVDYALRCRIDVYTTTGAHVTSVEAAPAGGEYTISGDLLESGLYTLRVNATNEWYNSVTSLQVFVEP